jgi:rhodanese-related sulfurtransferase
MRNLVFVTLVAVSLAAGCAKQAPDAADRAGEVATLPTVTVDQLDSQLAAGCQAVDANNEATRKHMGVIPGAVLLTDYDDFKPGELPADKAKPLVFYCANTACGASHHAAEKALTAGYTNVKVLPAGIAGWVQAGKKVATI